MALLSVETKSGEVIVRGNKLAELIEVIVLKKLMKLIKNIQRLLKLNETIFNI